MQFADPSQCQLVQGWLRCTQRQASRWLHWHQPRLQDMDLPSQHLLRGGPTSLSQRGGVELKLYLGLYSLPQVVRLVKKSNLWQTKSILCEHVSKFLFSREEKRAQMSVEKKA